MDLEQVTKIAVEVLADLRHSIEMYEELADAIAQAYGLVEMTLTIDGADQNIVADAAAAAELDGYTGPAEIREAP